MPRTTVATLPGGPVEVFRIGRAPGPVAHLMTLGAAVHRLEVTGGDGVRRDVVLGHDTVEGRLAGTEFHGAVVGRYANRIARGHLPLPGPRGTTDVQLGVNDRGHHLHGGPDGWHHRLWRVAEHDESRVRLTLVSPDGDQGYPGEVEMSATYAVQGATLSLELTGTTTRTTVLNPTNHSYLHLGGTGSGTVDDHRLQVHASHYTPTDDTGIPLGAHEPVDRTPFDLRGGARLGDVVRDAHPQVRAARGLDHNLVLDGPLDEDGMRLAAVLSCPATRTSLRLRTDRPGLQVYTGNVLDGSSVGHGGRHHRQGDGVALETQLFPDSPHHPEWPSSVLRPGERFRARTSWTVVGDDPGRGAAQNR